MFTLPKIHRIHIPTDYDKAKSITFIKHHWTLRVCNSIKRWWRNSLFL